MFIVAFLPQWQIVLISSVLEPVAFEASAFFIMTGDTVVANAAPPAIRLEFRRNERRVIAPGMACVNDALPCESTTDEVLVNFFMSLPRLNVSRLIVGENVRA